MTIDALDARLIAELRANPRVGLLGSPAGWASPGDGPGAAPKLEDRGVVTGHGPEVDAKAMGFPISASFLWSCRRAG